jgi:hypothetical protein
MDAPDPEEEGEKENARHVLLPLSNQLLTQLCLFLNLPFPSPLHRLCKMQSVLLPLCYGPTRRIITSASNSHPVSIHSPLPCHCALQVVRTYTAQPIGNSALHSVPSSHFVLPVA